MNGGKGNIFGGVLFVLLILAAVAASIVYFQKNNLHLGISSLQNINQLVSKKTFAVPSDWKTYRNEVIGIEFRYPADWGEPKTEPKDDITQLSTIIDAFRSPSNLYNDSIAIRFGNEGSPSLELFDKSHVNEVFTAAFAKPTDYIDNFSELVKSGNICNYKVNFPYLPDYRTGYSETYAACSDGVKTYITKKTESFDTFLYSYYLVNASYAKLQNGIFDNVLIKQAITQTIQIKQNSYTLDQLLSDNHLSKIDFEKSTEQFKIFANSIKSFPPPKLTPPPQKSPNIDNPEIGLILDFYLYLTDHQLDKAYNLYFDDSVKFDTFQSWYKNLFYARPHDFKKTAPDQYQFFVDYQDHNTPPKKYRVTMQIINNKIRTLSSEWLVGEPKQFQNLTAFVKNQSDHNYVVLSTDGVEKNVDQALAIPGNVHSQNFEIETFSPDGQYLMYRSTGWEWSSVKVYNIVGNKVVLTLPSAAFFTFSPDNKDIFACASDHFGGDMYANVYSLESDPPKVRRLIEEMGEIKFFDVGCGLDEQRNGMRVRLFNDSSKEIAEYLYSFTDKTLSPVNF